MDRSEGSSQKTGIIILLMSGAVFLYFLMSRKIIQDVYEYAAIGAIFEFLWMFMWLLVLAIPILSIRSIIKKDTPRWLPILSILVIGATITIILT